MIFRNINLIILFIFLISCDQYSSNKTKIKFKPDKKYKNSGFALIYNDDLKLKKLDQRSLQAFHKTLKAKSQVKITNPLNDSLMSAIITPDKDIIPDAETLNPAYIVFDNYEVILKWNRSLRFALAVCTLKDKFKNEI